jgi:hypothetical protein
VDRHRAIERLLHPYADRVDGAWCFATRDVDVVLTDDVTQHLVREVLGR